MTDIGERLRGWCTDWNGAAMAPGECPRDGLHFDDLLAAAAEIERLRLTPQQAYLQIVEGWLRNNRGIHFAEGAVDDLCKRIARALESNVKLVAEVERLTRADVSSLMPELAVIRRVMFGAKE